MSKDIKDRIRSYIMQAAKISALDDKDEIIEKNYLDSLGFIAFGTWLEKEFGIRMTNEDFTEENFWDLDSITRFVETKLENKKSESGNDG